MYQVGDYLVYGMEGVCRVANVGHPKLSGVSRTQLYYTLVPVGKTDSIYIPVDTQVYMRPPLSREAVLALLEALPALPVCADLPADARLLAPYYQEIIASHDCERLLRLYKTIWCKQQILAGSRRSLSVTDMRYWKQAENLLLGEIAFVLDIPYAEAVKTVRQRLGEASQATPAP